MIGREIDQMCLYLQQSQRRELEVPLSWMERVDVVTVGNAEELIETLLRWQKLRLISEVPLAEDARFVSRGL